MTWPRVVVARIGEMFGKRRQDARLDEELETHLEMLAEENRRRGMSPEEALRAAKIALGGTEQVKEAVRSKRGLPWLESLAQDVRFGLRMLQKNAGFTTATVLTLALGISATTVMFSVIDSVLLHPFTFRDADRIVFAYIHDPAHPTDDGRSYFKMPEFADFRQQNHVFEDIMGMNCRHVLYSQSGGPEGTQDFRGCLVTGNTFAFLGVEPLRGRWITDDDAKPSGTPVFAISYKRWKSQFNGDPKILGQNFILDGKSTTLVAVMPPRFTLGSGDVWMPIAVTHSDVIDEQIGIPLSLEARGRLKRGVSPQTAAEDLEVIARGLSNVYPKDYPKQFTVVAKTLADATVGNFRGMLYALMAAVTMLLLIACSNVANLLLVRATTREKEMALRATLGATRGRLVGQLIAESLVLSLLACVAGCALAYFALKAVVALLPIDAGVPTDAAFGLNAGAFAFAIVTAIVATLSCGLAPAVNAVRDGLSSRLMGAGKGAGGGHPRGRLRAALVVSQVALSILLLTGAGLMVRTLFALEHVDLGFDPKNVLFLAVALPSGRYDAAQQKRALFEQVVGRIKATPGVVAATETIATPPLAAVRTDVTVPGKTHTERWESMLDFCGDDYFRTLGIPLLRGSTLSAADIESGRHVVVVNQLLARKYFGSNDPIGQTIKFDFLDRLPDVPRDASFEVIGVVKDFRNNGLRDSPMPGAFVPYTVSGGGRRALLVKTANNPLAMLETIRREVWAVDPNVALGDSFSLEGFLKQYFYAAPEFGLAVFAVFGVVGVTLVVIGVFSVMAYNVSLQTHDIGVRMALGAQRNDILRMFLRSGAVLIALGAGVGLATSYALAGLMASQVWGISATDSATFASVVAIVTVVGLAACALPAALAARINPNVALRYE